jgi:hypothetical protein
MRIEHSDMLLLLFIFIPIRSVIWDQAEQRCVILQTFQSVYLQAL